MKSKAVDNLRVRLGSGETFPDPADISSTGKWDFLSHISSSLTRFEHATDTFEPDIASDWSVDKKSREHTFHLKRDAAFHDGTPLTAQDVVASLKRLLILKSSTHLPLWDYIANCDAIKSIDDDCEGLRALDAHTVRIKLKIEAESFFLQLSTPETGIWWRGDLLKPGPFTPTKYSGAYSVESFDKGHAILKRNPTSEVSKKFPDSPKQIECLSMPTKDMNEAMLKGDVDIFSRSHDPLGEPDWTAHGISVYGSSVSSFLYLQGSSRNGQELIGRDLLESFWNYAPKGEALPADTFMPASMDYSLDRTELLSLYPARSAKTIRVAVPWTYFSNAFLDRIRAAAQEVGVNLQYTALDMKAWFAAAGREGNLTDFDYVLIPYATSGRYAAVDLRFIVGDKIDFPFDLKKAESPGKSPEKIQILKDSEKWLASKQHTVPLYFLRSQITYNSKFDLGDQTPNESDMELWRVTKK